MEILNILVWSLIFVLIVSIVYISPVYTEILEPSYMSVKVSCGSEDRSLEGMNNYAEQFGWVVNAVYSPKNDSVAFSENLTVGSGEYQTMMRHEECHRIQTKKGILYGCSKKVLRFLNEVEAYLAGEWGYRC